MNQQLKDPRDNEPVLVVKSKEGIIIHVGDPKSFSAKTTNEYIQQGCKIETMKLSKFKLLKKGLYEA